MKFIKYTAICLTAIFLWGVIGGWGLDEIHAGTPLDPGQNTSNQFLADYSDCFQSIQGCAVFYDSSAKKYTLYNQDQCNTQVSPCSTFKVISTLMGLHNQVLTSQESKMGYDGADYPVEEWNADLNLKEAFQSSCIWYFRKVIDQVGMEEVQKELMALEYGNCDVSQWDGSNTNPLPQLNGFWLESSLKISPLEQVEVLKNIIEGDSIFTQEEVEILKSVMLTDLDTRQKIYGKTGTGTSGNAWFIGFSQTEEGNIYFAVYLKDETAEKVTTTQAKEIVYNILQEYYATD